MGIVTPVLRQVLLLGLVLGIRTDACTALTRYLEFNGACSVTLRTHNGTRMKGSFWGSSRQTQGSPAFPGSGILSSVVWAVESIMPDVCSLMWLLSTKKNLLFLELPVL